MPSPADAYEYKNCIIFSFSRPIYSLGPPWPTFDHPMECDDEETFENLSRFLEKRIATRNTLIADHKEQRESCPILFFHSFLKWLLYSIYSLIPSAFTTIISKHLRCSSTRKMKRHFFEAENWSYVSLWALWKGICFKILAFLETFKNLFFFF